MKTKIGVWAVVCSMVVWSMSSCSQAPLETQWKNVASKDGVTIAYSVTGSGETTLVFVHGWGCDSRYWHHQVERFKKDFEVITIDLAGHGHSALGRAAYSMESYGDDVVAVLEREDVKHAILIGHSMSGAIVSYAALGAPERVKGIIGVDTLQNVEKLTPEPQLEKILAPFKVDFAQATQNFVRSMFVQGTDQQVVEWIVSDMASHVPQVGLESIVSYVSRNFVPVFDTLKVPVRCINADLWATDVEVNKKHIHDYKLYLMKGYGHFIMLENPTEFNQLLKEAVDDISKR